MKKPPLVHQNVYEALIQSLSQESERSIPQCYFVAGEAGIGKTFLLKEITAFLQTSKKLEPIYIDCTMEPSLDFDDFTNLLISKSSEKKKRQVILLDNFTDLLQRWDKISLSRLRAFLYTEGTPILIATGREITPQLTEYEEPLYDSLSLITLKGISLEATIAIIKAQNNIGPEQDKIIEEIYAKIGGTPLIAALLSDYINKPIQSSEDIIKDMLNVMTLYFRDKLARLTLIQRKIVVELLKSPTPLSLGQLREATNLKSSDLTPQISRLNAAKIVYVSKQESKKSLYGIADKLFKTWYEENLISQNGL
ncbi:hypothetical protein [Phocaeicola sp.]